MSVVSLNPADLDESFEPEHLLINLDTLNSIPQEIRYVFWFLAIYAATKPQYDKSNPQIIKLLGSSRTEFASFVYRHKRNKMELLTDGLDSLCKIGAIVRKSRGIYEINREYALIPFYFEEGESSVVSFVKALRRNDRSMWRRKALSHTRR